MLDIENIQNFIRNIEKKPGVYQFINKKGEVIYVGKAKVLRNRVRSYFAKSTKHSPKNKVMIKQIADIKTIVVDTELEALLLETNLIKEIRPKYNILMKDDKNFCYLKIIKTPEPKLFIVRKVEKDSAIYIGPKTTTQAITTPINILNQILNVSNCQINIESIKKGRATKTQLAKPICHIKQLDKSHKPCISDLDIDDQMELINIIIDFFKGKYTKIEDFIMVEIQKLANNKKFEEAAKLRDNLFYIRKLAERQKISSTNIKDNFDIITQAPCGEYGLVNLMKIRSGKLIETSHHLMTSVQYDEMNQEIFSNFIRQYYSKTESLPATILTNINTTSVANLELLISNLTNKKIKIQHPKTGSKVKLIDLCQKNANLIAHGEEKKQVNKDPKQIAKLLKAVQEDLKLESVPKRIECYDISHLSGTKTVASMVVFENGVAKKTDYRQFDIRSIDSGDINDFQSMTEALTRRLKYISKIDKTYKCKYSETKTKLIKDKKEIGVVEFTKINNTNLDLKKIIGELSLLEIKHIIYKTLEKNKIKKIYYSQKLTNDLKEIGFKEIKSKYKHALYSSHINKDKSFNKTPDLIVIDGGKGQLSAALKAQTKLNTNIEFISIAKRLEEIFKMDKGRILLPENSKTLQLIQRLRNEAHRFAITHNRKKRLKDYQ
jgi:excinuclease ABC subunit C